jgi:hypothetical protein
MSPHYLGSKRCRTELTRFGARLPPSWSDRRGRIFVARAVDTGQEPWPDELRNEQDRVSNWRFYGDDDHNPWGFMRDWKGFVPDKMAGNFTRLANGVLDALENFQNEQVKEASQSKRNTKLRTGHAESIYLYAHPKEPAVWRAAKRKLEELGIKVLPDKPEDAGADSDRKQRDALIDAASRCDVMLMVSADPDRLQNDLEQIGRNRRQLIASRKKKYLPCAFVDQGGLLDADVLRSSAAPFDIDWLAVNNANWAELLRDWLRSAAEKIQKREGRQPHDPRGNSA